MPGSVDQYEGETDAGHYIARLASALGGSKKEINWELVIASQIARGADSPLSMKAWLFHLAYLIAVLTLVPLVPARADFFDDARKTLTVDIPHFFGHDIPCAFGGRPTGHTETSCKSAGHPAKQGSGARHTSHAAKHNVASRNQESPRIVLRFRDASGQPCRIVNETVLIDGEKTRATGTVCRESDGHWTIVAARDRAVGATATVECVGRHECAEVNGTAEIDNE